MARPAKSAEVTSKHLTNQEKSARLAAERGLRGNADKIRPPTYLTKEQKKIFREIVREINAAGILGNLDVYILTTCAISIDRLREIENEINENKQVLGDGKLLAAKEKYTKDLFRCCNELCMSPQSRAKMGTLNLAAQKPENPLKKALQDDDDE